MTFTLRLLGGASLEGENEALSGGVAQRHRIALLALLVSSPSRAVNRDKLIALLWPQRDQQSGRALLNQCVYVIRQALGEGAVHSAGDELRLDPDRIRCDVTAFEQALQRGDDEHATTLYTGPFLDGFFLSESAEFEHWTDRQRGQLADAYKGALERLAAAAETQGDFRASAEHWAALTAHDPYDSRFALRLMIALAADGNPAGALHHATAHEQLLRDELNIGPPAEMTDWIKQLRAESMRSDIPSQISGEHVSEVLEKHERFPSKEKPSKTSRSKRPAAILRVVAAALALSTLIFVAVRKWPPQSTAPTAQVVQNAPAAEEIARAVARELERRRLADSPASRPEQRTHSIAAYELYLRASDPALLRTDSKVRKALEYFQQAVALDSAYAAAWAGVSRMSLLVAARPLGVAPDLELWKLSEKAALNAVSAGDSIADTHAALSLVRMLQFNFAAAEASLRRAIALDPARARFHEWMANVYLWTGRLDEAFEETQEAVELEPLSPSSNAEYARVLLSHRRPDEALNHLRGLADVQPPLLRVSTIAAQCYARKQMWQKAAEILRDYPDGRPPVIEGFLGYLLARAGRRTEALSLRASLLEQWQLGSAGAFPIALVSAGLGEIDETLSWLGKALDDRSLMGGADHFTILEPILQRLEGDERIDALAERMGYNGE